MKLVTRMAVILAILPIGTASFALMPLPKEKAQAIEREWRTAPFHVQAEVLSTRHPPRLDTSRCGEVTAVVRRAFKGGEHLPLGSSLTFDHCIHVLNLEFTDFDREFQPGRKLEAVLAYDPAANGKAMIVGGGLMQIREFSEKPQLRMSE